MSRLKIGACYYTELEVMQKINNLKIKNSELRKDNQAIKIKLQTISESRSEWRKKYFKLKNNLRKLI